MTREYRGAETEAEAKSERGARAPKRAELKRKLRRYKEQTCNLSGRLVHSKRVDEVEAKQESNGEFDPGSGRTLAACLTHASRTGLLKKLAFEIVKWRTGE